MIGAGLVGVWWELRGARRGVGGLGGGQEGADGQMGVGSGGRPWRRFAKAKFLGRKIRW
jgi:hypothetical protein